MRPQQFDDLVPTALPGSVRAWNHGAGAAELAVAATLLNARTRRLGGALAAVLFICVFPGNVKMAWDSRHRSGTEQAFAYGRLPLQIPLVLWALRIRRRSP